MEKIKEAYKEILGLLNKYRESVVFDVSDLERRAKNHLFGVELVESYGFKIDPKIIRSTDWQELMSNVYIGFWDGERRKISYPDDGRQPKNETLLCFKYPTGAYIFGGDYPTKFFQKFFLELKTYQPKYTDTCNHCLYFSLENAGKIYNEYKSILKRYYKENEEDIKQRKIKQMRADLAKLESN